MASESGEFKYESLQDCETIVKYFKAITEGFQSGKLSLANGGSPIVLEPKGLLKLDLKARRKDDRIRLMIKISWKEEEEYQLVDNPPLKIDAKQS